MFVCVRECTEKELHLLKNISYYRANLFIIIKIKVLGIRLLVKSEKLHTYGIPHEGKTKLTFLFVIKITVIDVINEARFIVLAKEVKLSQTA